MSNINDNILSPSNPDYKTKVENTIQLNFSPNISILIPYSYTSEQDLLNKYEEYTYLGHKFRLMSDEYSRQIWGYPVSDIFTFEKERLLNMNEPMNDYDLDTELDVVSSNESVESCIESMISNDDKLGLLEERLKQYYSNTPASIKEFYENQDTEIMNTVNQKFDKKVWSECVSEYVPYFTLDEMTEESLVGKIDYERWKDLLIEAVKEGDTDKIYKLGWNPSVEFTTENINYAKERQLNWLEHKIPQIIDIQGISEKFDTVLSESGDDAKKVYRENNMYPLFIVLSYTGSVVGQIINKVKNSEWSHAGIATDVSLSAINSYNFRGKEYNGFTEDNLSRYLKENGDTLIEVLCIFADRKTFAKVKSNIRNIKNRSKEGHYDFANLINIAFNRAKKLDYPENVALVCSQFTDLVLRVANIELVNKPNNLVIPQDFSNIATKNPRVYKVYKGLARRYNEKTIENDIIKLIQNKKVENIIPEDELVEDEKGVSETLNIMNNLLTPENSIAEVSFPIFVKNNGDITIEFRKDLEQQYQESHRLLTTYTAGNLDGIKNELAHLFYMNSIIELKINKMKKRDDNYKLLVDLRARVLNDFKKYMKVVMEQDPEFNFAEYFKNSNYFNAGITLDHGLMKLSGKLIRKFFDK